MLEKFPSVSILIEATIHVISKAKGEIKNDQITQGVIDHLKISPEMASKIHSGKRTELDYRLAWARTKAVKRGAIVWVAPSTWEIAK